MIKGEVQTVDDLATELSELIDLDELAKDDADLARAIPEHLEKISKILDTQEIKVFLSGKYDSRGAVLTISAGAGGDEAQDWTAMLARMYQRYAEKKGFDVKIIHQSEGEVSPTGSIGFKQVVMEIDGPYAYGYLKKENGVHRLVRISPFSSQSLRHTSFASVEVIPDIAQADEKELEINPAELRIEMAKSGGAGGQNVNKRETAVRIVHIPTNIVATSQNERSQFMNKEKAMKILLGRLYQLKEQEVAKEVAQVKGAKMKIEFGSQIRSYVLQPYKMVKDLRTDVETSQADKVLDGEIEEFIQAQVRSKDF